MGLHLRPVGPLPPGVYWRRRALVLAALLLVLVLLRSCTGDDPEQLSSAGPSPAPAAPGLDPLPLPSSSTAAGASASPTPTPAPSASACAAEQVQVQVQPVGSRLTAGRPVRLTLAARNTGTAPCAVPFGSGALEVLVYSGRDRIWSSDDCSPGGDDAPQVLQPQERVTTTVTWPGRRSRPSCEGATAPVEAGTYRLVARVGPVTEQGPSFPLR